MSKYIDVFDNIWLNLVLNFQLTKMLRLFCCPSGTKARIFLGDYRQVSNIRRTLVGNQIVDHSDVVGASPVGAATTTSSFST